MTQQVQAYKNPKAKASQTQLKQYYVGVDPSTIVGNNAGRNYILGYGDMSTRLVDFHDIIKYCRWFYTYDPIAGTVIERMADMSITALRNRRQSKRNGDPIDDITMAYFDAIAKRIKPFIKLMALEYLITGMVVPEYALGKIRGNILADQLGRKRYWVPENLWVRNADNIMLKRKPMGTERQVYLRIPSEDIQLVQSKGIRSDGTTDKESYQYLLDNFPEYVEAILKGETKILLPEAKPVLRKINSHSDYPTPYLTKAIRSLQHKEYLKAMDRSIASRAIEAIRHIRVGDKDFPADDDDIDAVKDTINQNSSSGERIFNLFTNHTVSIEWVYPSLEALMNEAKYAEPNADIFLGLGFPRILTVGETLRSNSSDSKIASLGPKATLDDMRESLISWLEILYFELAEKNGLSVVPEPYFSPIATSDYTALVQFAIQALESGAISRDTVAQLYGSDYETEAAQIESEQGMGILSPTELSKEKDREFSRETMQKQQDQQLKTQQTQQTQTKDKKSQE